VNSANFYSISNFFVSIIEGLFTFFRSVPKVELPDEEQVNI